MRAWLAPLLICALAGGAMWASCVDKSATIDEGEELWSGWLALVRGDYSINPHPPLHQLWSAAPLVIAGAAPRHPERLPSPRYEHAGGVSDQMAGHAFLFDNTLTWRRLLQLGRGAAILLTLLGLLGCWAGARRMYGDGAALWVLAMLATLPTLHAFGRLATTDHAVTATSCLALLALGRYLESPSRGGLVLAGLITGVAVSCKTSTIYLAGVAPLCVLLCPELGRLRRRLALGAALVALAASVLVASFGVVHLPEYWSGWRVNVGDRAANPHPYWMMGGVHTGGEWRFVLLGLAIKVPHAHQLACVAAVASLLWRRPTRAELPLVVGSAALLAGMLVARINLGVRHAAPLICYLTILAARLRPPAPRVVAAALVLWSAASLARCWPHTLAYANEAAGGPARMHWWQLDSNLDLGQDLGGLSRWMAAHDAPMVYLAYSGTAEPTRSGVRYRYLPTPRPYTQPPGTPGARWPTRGPRYLAISVTLLHLDQPGYYRWLADREPVAIIGHTIRVYDVSDRAAAQALARLYARSVPGALGRRLSQEELRRAHR